MFKKYLEFKDRSKEKVRDLEKWSNFYFWIFSCYMILKVILKMKEN
jgi:hypothetical protein